MPASRKDFWRKKFAATIKRDKKNRRKLLQEGWRIATVWECSFRNKEEKVIAFKIERWLQGKAKEFHADGFAGL